MIFGVRIGVTAYVAFVTASLLAGVTNGIIKAGKKGSINNDDGGYAIVNV